MVAVDRLAQGAHNQHMNRHPPDGCISRQRIWGVPIAVFLCESCNQPIVEPALNRGIVELFEKETPNPGTPRRLRNCFPLEPAARTAAARTSAKEVDILDVWFDSGVSWFAVCESDPELKPAYSAFQKGAAQTAHRSSTSKARPAPRLVPLLAAHLRRAARPRSLLARRHRWLDARRTGPRHVEIPRQTASILSILQTEWAANRPPLVASVDFREDMAARRESDAALRRTLQKAAQHLPLPLGNLAGFDPARDRVAKPSLFRSTATCWRAPASSRRKFWASTRPSSSTASTMPSTSSPIVDLSAFYLDVLKDRMYTFAPTSKARRSAQTVLWQITRLWSGWSRPSSAFTADEVWEYPPKVEGREASVHLALLPQTRGDFQRRPGAGCIEEWEQLS